MSSHGSRVDIYARPPNIVEVRLLDQGVFYSLDLSGKQLVIQRLALSAHIGYPQYLLKDHDERVMKFDGRRVVGFFNSVLNPSSPRFGEQMPPSCITNATCVFT